MTLKTGEKLWVTNVMKVEKEGGATQPSIIHYVLKISAEKCGQMIIIIVVIALWEGGRK